MLNDKLPDLPPRPQTTLGLFKTFEVVEHMDAQDARITQLTERVGELECFVNTATELQGKQSQRIAELEREIRELQKTLLEAICEFPYSCQKNVMEHCGCRKCVIERSSELLQPKRNAERENGQ